jgi:hypothetical protein
VRLGAQFYGIVSPPGAAMSKDDTITRIPLDPKAGRIHARRINDPRYVNICVEQINYTPVSYDWLIAKARKAMT